MAEYTIKLVDIAAEARERLGDELAHALMSGDEPDWRFVVIKGKRRIYAPSNALATYVYQILDGHNVKPDDITAYLTESS